MNTEFEEHKKECGCCEMTKVDKEKRGYGISYGFPTGNKTQEILKEMQIKWENENWRLPEIVSFVFKKGREEQEKEIKIEIITKKIWEKSKPSEEYPKDFLVIPALDIIELLKEVLK